MPLLTWTAEQEAELRRLWAEGLSAGRIAAATGRTKNSIIGRAHRLGLPRRESPIPAASSAEGGASKRCARCGVLKTLGCFTPLERGVLKRHPYCKACRNAAAKALGAQKRQATTIPERVAALAAIPAAAARGQPQRPETPAVTRPAPEAGATPAASPAAAGGSPAPYARVAAPRPAAWWRTMPIHYPADLGCRWIQGEPRGAETLFCDAARVPHRPYCPAHCARAYHLWRGPDATAAGGHAAPGRSSGNLRDVSSQTAPAGQPAAPPAALSGRDAA